MLLYLRSSQVGDVLASGLACLLDFLLLLVDHDLACLHGAAVRESELWPRNRTGFSDDLEEEADLYSVSWYSPRLSIIGDFSHLLSVGPTFGGSFLRHGECC